LLLHLTLAVQSQTRGRRLVVALSLVAFVVACGSPTGPGSVSDPSRPTQPGRYDVLLPGAGVDIAGILYRPDEPAPRPAVLVIHGYLPPGTVGAATIEQPAQVLASLGYVALAISMRGWPYSTGSDDCGLQQPDDTADAVEWLARLPGVDPNRIGVLGFSQGGQVALLTGTRSARVRSIVAYYPVTDVERWKVTTAFPGIPEYITAVCEPGGADRRSPALQADRISAEVLLVHGDRDTRVPTEQSLLMQSALERVGRQCTLFLVPGAQHGFTNAEEALARPVVEAFLARTLREP
jgi:dipeptidyl aminopeptidase/acylaminoacyl peptidase